MRKFRKHQAAYTVEQGPDNGFSPAAVVGVHSALAPAGSPRILTRPQQKGWRLQATGAMLWALNWNGLLIQQTALKRYIANLQTPL